MVWSTPLISRVNVSTHPLSHPVDATRISVDHIAQEIPKKSSSLMTRLHFVNMSDSILHKLFVSDSARSRQSILLTYPPKHHRHIAKQIPSGKVISTNVVICYSNSYCETTTPTATIVSILETIVFFSTKQFPTFQSATQYIF